MSPSLEVKPDPRLEKRTRHRFSGTEKQKLLTEYESLGHGEKGAEGVNLFPTFFVNY